MKKPLETAIAKNCTLLTSVQRLHVIATHQPDTECLIITFTDGLQVEYLCPSGEDYYLALKEQGHNTTCIVLYPECVPAELTFKVQK